MRWTAWIAVATFSMLLAACNPSSTIRNPRQLVSHEYSSDAPIRLELIMDECGTACDEVGPAMCSVTVEEDAIMLDVLVVIEPSTDTTCPQSCVYVYATCEVGELPAGTYRVVSEDFEDEIVVE